MIRSSIAVRIQRGNMKLRMCGYSDSGEQGIGMHEMEVSPLIIECHQIRQHLFLLHIPCSHQRLIAHPSFPLLSRPSRLKHLLVVSIFVPSSLQQTPQSTQSLISLFVHFTPGVFSVLISVVYTICALRVDDCSSSLPHLFHILPPLHEDWLELGTYCSLSWYVYKGREWSPLYGSFFAPSFCGNSLSVWSVQKESLPCLSSNNGISCVSFLPTPWTLENGILFYLYLLLHSHCHIGIVAMHQSLCISLSLCRIMKPRIAKLFCFHTPLLACVRWQLGLHVSWLAPCFHNNNVIE